LIERGRVDAGGESLYYEIEGDGPALVLVHGWTLNCRMWDDQRSAFSARHRVICYDRRGFGRSSGQPDTVRDVDDLVALLDRLDVPRATVLGMSQGGWTAVYFALDHPDRTDALILQGSILPGLNLPFTGADRVPSDRYAEAARASGMDAMRALWIGHPFYAVARTRPDVERRLRDMVQSYSGDDLSRVKVPPLGGGRDAVGRLAELQMPVLILVGDSDVPYVKVVAAALAYGMPHAKTIVLPGCDHLANMEAPEIYNQAVLQFLDDAQLARRQQPADH